MGWPEAVCKIGFYLAAAAIAWACAYCAVGGGVHVH